MYHNSALHLVSHYTFFQKTGKTYFPFLLPCTKVFSPHSQSSYEINNLPVSCHKTSNSVIRKACHPFLHHLQYSTLPFRTKASKQPKLFGRHHQQVHRGKNHFLNLASHLLSFTHLTSKLVLQPQHWACCLSALLPNFSTLHRLTFSLLSGQSAAHTWLLSRSNVAIFLPRAGQPSHWLWKEAKPTGAAYADAAKRLFHTGEVDLASSALLHIWLNTKTSCVGPAHEAILAALSNSLSFVYHSANICPMQKFYLQQFDTCCHIRCKHWITFDLQLISAEQFWEVLPW